MYDTQVWAHSTGIREEISETRRSNYNLLGPASLPCLSRDLLVSLKNSNANSLRLIPLCVLFCHTWTLHKTIPRIFFLSLLYSNAFAKVFEGLLFHKVEVRSWNPIYFDFTLMRYLLRTKAENFFFVDQMYFGILQSRKKDIQSRISVNQTFGISHVWILFSHNHSNLRFFIKDCLKPDTSVCPNPTMTVAK